MWIIYFVLFGGVCSFLASIKNKNIGFAFICGILFNVFAVLYYLFCNEDKQLTQEELNEFVKNSSFIKVNCPIGIGLQLVSGKKTINKGLSDLGYNTFESLVEYLIDNGFIIKEHNERTNEYILQKEITKQYQ